MTRIDSGAGGRGGALGAWRWLEDAHDAPSTNDPAELLFPEPLAPAEQDAGRPRIGAHTTTRAIGSWQLASELYRTRTAAATKEKQRLLRQANVTWRSWPNGVIPAQTTLAVPYGGAGHLPVPDTRTESVLAGDGVTQVLARAARREGGITVPTPTLLEMAWEVGTLNGVAMDAQGRSDVEPGWRLLVPTRFYDAWRRRQPSPYSGQPDVQDRELSGTTAVRIAGNEDLIEWFLGSVFNGVLTYRNGPWNTRFEYHGDHVRVYGSNQVLARSLRVAPVGRRYRIGSASYQRMAASVASSQAVLLRQTGSFGQQLGRQLVNVGRSGAGAVLSRASLLGAGFSVGMDVAEAWATGHTERLRTSEFWIGEVGENVAKGAVATAAGAMAAAATSAAMGAAFGSVVPGVGTVVGFLVGALVGLAMTGTDWW